MTKSERYGYSANKAQVLWGCGKKVAFFFALGLELFVSRYCNY